MKRQTKVVSTPYNWTVTAPAWDKSQGCDRQGRPKLTLMQSVCALGYCIEHENHEDAYQHCLGILEKLYAKFVSRSLK